MSDNQLENRYILWFLGIAFVAVYVLIGNSYYGAIQEIPSTNTTAEAFITDKPQATEMTTEKIIPDEGEVIIIPDPAENE